MATVAWAVVTDVATVVQAVAMARMGMAATIHPVAEDTGHTGSTENIPRNSTNWSTQAS